jgi:hypothetical protein
VTVGGSFALFKEKLVMAWNSSGLLNLNKPLYNVLESAA